MSTADRRLATSTPDAGGHLLPAAPAQPELTAEWRVRYFFRSTKADEVTGVLTKAEALDLASRLQHVAFVLEVRHVGPWAPASNVQRNRVVRDEVDRDDPADLHPNAVPDDDEPGAASDDDVPDDDGANGQAASDCTPWEQPP